MSSLIRTLLPNYYRLFYLTHLVGRTFYYNHQKLKNYLYKIGRFMKLEKNDKLTDVSNIIKKYELFESKQIITNNNYGIIHIQLLDTLLNIFEDFNTQVSIIHLIEPIKFCDFLTIQINEAKNILFELRKIIKNNSKNISNDDCLKQFLPYLNNDCVNIIKQYIVC